MAHRHLTVIPGGDGRTELANVRMFLAWSRTSPAVYTVARYGSCILLPMQIWRMKAKMLYQMERMKQAFECVMKWHISCLATRS